MFSSLHKKDNKTLQSSLNAGKTKGDKYTPKKLYKSTFTKFLFQNCPKI